MMSANDEKQPLLKDSRADHLVDGNGGEFTQELLLI